MVSLITYPLQVPNAPVALIEVGDFQAALLRKYLGEEVQTANLENDVEDIEEVVQLQEPISPIVSWEEDRSVPDSSQQKSPEQDALWIYRNLAPNAHAVLDQLVNTWRNEGDEGFVHGQVLARSLNLEPPQFRGSLASFEIRAKAVSRPNPVRFERGVYGGSYSLDVDAAPAFETAQRVKQCDERHDMASTAAYAVRKRYEESEGEDDTLRDRLLEELGKRDDEEIEAYHAMEKIHAETGI